MWFPVSTILLVSSTAAGAETVIDAYGKNGAIPLASTSEPLKVVGAYRVIETVPGTVAEDVIIENLTGIDIQREGVRLRGALSRITLRNFNFQHSTTPNSAPDLPEGIHVESGANITIQSGIIGGFQMQMAPDRYWNGDGIATEPSASNVTIRDVTVQDNTDGGLDLKSSGNHLERVTSARNTRNFRFWSDVEAGTITSIEPTKRGGTASMAHVHIAGSDTSPPRVHIAKLIVRATTSIAPILLIENGAAFVTIDDYDIDVPPGTKPLVGGARATISWGAKGRPNL